MAKNWWEDDAVATAAAGDEWWSADAIQGQAAQPEVDAAVANMPPSIVSEMNRTAPGVIGSITRGDNVRSVLGVDPTQVDWRNQNKSMGWVDRASIGFLNNDADMQRRLRGGLFGAFGAMPEAEVKTVDNRRYWRENPADQWKPVDPEVPFGQDTSGEFADFAAAVPETLAETAAFLMKRSPAGIAGSAMLGQGTEEAVKGASGYETNATTSVPLTGAFSYGGAKLGSLFDKGVNTAGNVATGRQALGGVPDSVRAAEGRIAQEFPDAPHLMPHQVSESKILQRGAAQSRYTSREGIIPQERAQQDWTMEALRSLGPTADKAAALESQKQALRNARDSVRNDILAGEQLVTRSGAGESMQRAVDVHLKNSGTKVRGLYRQADDLAKVEMPTFDLSGAQSTAAKIRQGIEGVRTETIDTVQGMSLTTGRPIVSSETEQMGVRVAGPEGALASVSRKLEQLDPTQPNYETVKVLRTQLYDLLDNPAWAWDANKANASRLYRELTESLMNPSSSAPGYKAAIREANDAARQRFKLMDKKEIRQAVVESNVYKIGDLLVPGEMTPAFVGAVKAGGKAEFETMVAGARANILRSENPLKSYQEWSKHPEVFEKLFTESERAALQNTVKRLDALRGTRISEIADSTSRSATTVRELAQGYDSAGMKQIVGKMSDAEKQALKEGIYMDFLQNTVSRGTRDGKEVLESAAYVDAGKFSDLYATYKNSGALDLLFNATERERLHALGDYVMLTNGTLSDVGAALEGAQIMSQLKNVHEPSGMLKGVISLKLNTLIAKFMANPTGSKVLLGRNSKKPFDQRSMQLLGMILGTAGSSQVK